MLTPQESADLKVKIIASAEAAAGIAQQAVAHYEAIDKIIGLHAEAGADASFLVKARQAFSDANGLINSHLNAAPKA